MSSPRAMTGFVSKRLLISGSEILVTIRAVNAKYLDVVTNFYPAGYVLLEAKLREYLSQVFERGRIEVSISVKEAPTLAAKLYPKNMKGIYLALNKLKKECAIKEPVKITDVLFAAEKQRSSFPGLNLRSDVILKLFREAIKALVSFKEKQGACIVREVGRELRTIKSQMGRLRNALARQVEETLSKEINEELTLLSFYLTEVHRVLADTRRYSFGKILDFLSQEMQREINTLLAKVKIKEASIAALYMKEEIEKIREHAQNIE